MLIVPSIALVYTLRFHSMEYFQIGNAFKRYLNIYRVSTIESENCTRTSTMCSRVYEFGAMYQCTSDAIVIPPRSWTSMTDRWNLNHVALKWTIQRNSSNTPWKKTIAYSSICRCLSVERSLVKIDFVTQSCENLADIKQRIKLSGHQVWLVDCSAVQNQKLSIFLRFQIELYGTDALHPDRIKKSQANLKLFRSYEEYVDKLISQALLSGVEARWAESSFTHEIWWIW